MTWKDKLEIGLKEDAPYRRDNLPEGETQSDGPPAPSTGTSDPSRSPEVPGARKRAESTPPDAARKK